MENISKRIEKETKRLKKKYPDADECLYRRGATFSIQAEDIEEVMQDQDYTVTTINASQRFVKANPLLEEYRKTTRALLDVIKLLEASLKKKPEEEPDDFENF